MLPVQLQIGLGLRLLLVLILHPRLALLRLLRLRERLQRFSNLPPDQRERRLEHLQRLEQLTPQERKRAEDLLDKFRVLPEDRKLLIGRAAGFLSRMEPQQQQQALESPRMRKQFSDQEREILHGVLDLRIGPASPCSPPSKGARIVRTRPPGELRASSRRTSRPARCSNVAARNPARPAPMMTMGDSEGSARR